MVKEISWSCILHYCNQKKIHGYGHRTMGRNGTGRPLKQALDALPFVVWGRLSDHCGESGVFFLRGQSRSKAGTRSFASCQLFLPMFIRHGGNNFVTVRKHGLFMVVQGMWRMNPSTLSTKMPSLTNLISAHFATLTLLLHHIFLCQVPSLGSQNRARIAGCSWPNSWCLRLMMWICISKEACKSHYINSVSA